MKIKNELKIGVMVVACLVLLVIGTVRTGNFHLGKKGYTVNVHFRNIDGIGENTPVMLNGLEVGLVKDIRFKELTDETIMELEVWLEEGTILREGAAAYVKNMGFLGEKYVGLASGKPGTAVLQAGTTIAGTEAADFDKILLDGREIATNIKEVSANLNERLKKNKDAIDQIIADFRTSMGKMVSITENVDERLAVNETKIDSLMTHLESTSINLDQFSYDLKLNPWKLMYRTKEERQKNIDMMKTESPQVQTNIQTATP